MAHITKDKTRLIHRTKRIIGQAEGIVHMIEGEADCNKILQAIAACRGGMNGLMSVLMEGHVREHVLPQKSKLTPSQEEAVDTLLNVINTYLR